MVEIEDLLFWGAVFVSLDNEGELIGRVFIQFDNGNISFNLSSDDLYFIDIQKGIMSKLYEGNVLYMINGNSYLGMVLDGEDEKFISEFDSESLTLSGMLQSLEYKVERSLGKRKKLLKRGNFYRSADYIN